MIDHMALQVSDLARSQAFYDQALAPLGYRRLMETPRTNDEGVRYLGWGDSQQTDIWMSEGQRSTPRLHIAFRADNHEQVDAFYRAALAAGGKHNGKPGLRPHYHAHYYAAYVLDPDDHNIEAVCHVPQGDGSARG
ncbi:MAG: VOC family protein [Planctomycetota bacterium]